jgi:hypothetical protein
LFFFSAPYIISFLFDDFILCPCGFFVIFIECMMMNKAFLVSVHKAGYFMDRT